jgi:hypothetical protein
MEPQIKDLIAQTIAPFLLSKGYQQVESYFFKIEGDLTFNFLIEPNPENTDKARMATFTISYGVYSRIFNETLGFPFNTQPSGLGNTFYSNEDDIKATTGNYWINTDQTSNILQLLQKAIDRHATTPTLESLFDLYWNLGPYFRTNHEYTIRYLKITASSQHTGGQTPLDIYIAAVRQELKTTNNQGASEWFESQLPRLLDTSVLKDKIKRNFPQGIKVPKPWEKVLDWVEKNPATVIGGHFEITENSKEMLKNWISDEALSNNLAVLGETAEQNLFCIWKKDKNTQPIVLLGEAGHTKIIAQNIEDFIQLLAIGYYEAEYANDQPPVFESGTEHWTNPKFQQFYKKTFKKEIPLTAKEIIKSASNLQFPN